MRPRTGAEYSWDLRPELARNWSASQRRFSSVAVAVSFSEEATSAYDSLVCEWFADWQAQYADQDGRQGERNKNCTFFSWTAMGDESASE
jgi:hypothetical protein